MVDPDVGDVKKQKQKEKEQEERAKNEHQLVFGAVYMNDPARGVALQTGTLSYPEGAIIVRERLKAAESPVAELLVVMIKREKGFNRAANDWEFLLINGEVTKIKKRQKTGDCQRCHAARSPNDFVMADYANQTLQIEIPLATPLTKLPSR